jgi:hypothetical protein
MAFGINSSDKKHFSETILYTGVSAVKVLGINPTLAQLQELGFKSEKEPEYTFIDAKDGVTRKVRIDIIIGNEKFKTKFAIFLADKNRIDNKGEKYEIVNDFGQSTWAPSVQEALDKIGKGGNKWFKPDGARIAKMGEVQLITFLRDWANTGVDEVGKIDNFDALFKGNFNELQQYVKALSNNTIYILATVKDGKYQSAYTGLFVRTQFSQRTAENKFSTHIADQKKAGYPLKEAYSINFKEYDGSAIEPDVDVKFNELDNSDKLQF